MKGIICKDKYTTLLDLARQAKILSGETACFKGGIQVGIPFSGYPTGVNTATAVSLGVVSTESALFQTIMVSGSTQSGTTTFDVSNPRSIYYENRFSGYTYQCLVDGWTGWTGCYGETGFTYCISTGVPTDICDGVTGFTENYINNWTNPNFSASTSGLTLPITNLSADTQTVGPYWTLTKTGMTGDYIIGTQYTGYTITYSFDDIFQYPHPYMGCTFNGDTGSTCSTNPGLGTGYTLTSTGFTDAYSGLTIAVQENFSAKTLDYKGPLDYLHSKEDATVEGKLTTNKLVVQYSATSATTGYVLTQVDDIGTAEWRFNSASAATNTFVVSGALDSSADLNLTYNTGGSVPPIDLSALSGDPWNLQSVLNEGTDPLAPPFTSTDSVGILSGDSIVIGTGDPFGSPPITGTTLIWLDQNRGRVRVAGYYPDLKFGETIISGENDYGESTLSVSGKEIDISTTGSTILLEADGNILIDGLSGLTNPTIGDVLSAKDTAGRLKWITPDSFTGGTGSCITDLYVTNIHGCSPITIHDPVQHISSSATGINSIAWGTGTTASGVGSHAEGEGTIASGEFSHAEGKDTKASGSTAHAEGEDTIASGQDSHAEGKNTHAAGSQSHAEGGQTIASGDTSHAGGFNTIASGEYSFIHGLDSTVKNSSGVILGGTNHNINVGSENSGIFAGSDNTIEEDFYNSIIVGGDENIIEVVTGITCGCPCGYYFNGVTCSKYADYSGASGVAISKGPILNTYGDRGGRFCIPNSYPGSALSCIDGNAIETGIHYRVSGESFWGTFAPDGRLNEVGIFNPTMVANGRTWYGFSRCINVPSDGQYLFGMAADNYVRATLNGEVIVALDWSASVVTEFLVAGMDPNDRFRQWWVWPVDLTAGSNTLLLEGSDDLLAVSATFGCEIVGPFTPNTFTATTDFHIFSGQTGIDLWTGNTIFNSLSMVAGTFDSETHICPDGYTYDSCSDSCLASVACEPGIRPNVIVGGASNEIRNSGSQYSGIIGGCENLMDGAQGSIILGGRQISGVTHDTTYVPNLNINYQPDIGNGLTQLLVRDTDGTVKYRDVSTISGGSGTFTGNTSGDCINELWVANISGCTGQDLHIGVQGGQDIYFDNASGTSTNPHLFINDKGQIGIGTNTPFSWAPTDGTGIEIHNDGSNDQIPLAFTESGTRRFFFETDFANTSNPVHIKGSSGTNLMTFNTSSSSARVGVGTTIPDGTFQIAKSGSIANQTKYPDETNLVINNTSNGYSGTSHPYSSAFRFDHGTGEDPGGLITSKRTNTWDSGEKSTTLEIWNASGETNFKRIEILPEWNTNIYGDITVMGKNGSKFITDLSNPYPAVRFSGSSSILSQIGLTNPDGTGINIGYRGLSEVGTPGYGKVGDVFVYSSAASNGLNIISQAGAAAQEDYIRFYAGQDASASPCDMIIVGTGTTRGFIGVGTEIPTEKLNVEGGNILVNHDQNDDTKFQIQNLNDGNTARSVINLIAAGEGIESTGAIINVGTGFTGSGTWIGPVYLPNSFNITTGGGNTSNRAHINIGSRRVDGETRIFGGANGFNDASLLGTFHTSGLTLTDSYSGGLFNTPKLRVRDGATIGDVLTATDNLGNVAWQSHIPFTGGSGDCIADLYVTNIHACSPLNINPNNDGNIFIGTGFTFDLTGNTDQRLGINTSTPQANLHIKGLTPPLHDNLFLIEDSLGNIVLGANDEGALAIGVDPHDIAMSGKSSLFIKGESNVSTGNFDDENLSLRVVNSSNNNLLVVKNGGPAWNPNIGRVGVNAQFGSQVFLPDDVVFYVKGDDAGTTASGNVMSIADGSTNTIMQIQNDSTILLCRTLEYGKVKIGGTLPAAKLHINLADTWQDVHGETLALRIDGLSDVAPFTATTSNIFTVDNFGNTNILKRTTTENFTMTSGATNDYVLTSDAGGNATWKEHRGASSASCLDELWVTIISGCSPVTIGSSVQSQGSTASGENSQAWGSITVASGEYSHAEGVGTLASGVSSHAEGNDTTASEENAHAEGDDTTASGWASHAEGEGTVASLEASHAEGRDTVASGNYSHAEGRDTVASGNTSHAQGEHTVAGGDGSHAGGHGAAGKEVLSLGDGSFAHFTIKESEPLSVSVGAYGDYTAILGGRDHNITSSGSTDSIIVGGQWGSIDFSEGSAIIGGFDNSISGFTQGTRNSNLIAGGYQNSMIPIALPQAVANQLQRSNSIMGGFSNQITGNTSYNSIIGGINNKIVGSLKPVESCAIIGGEHNILGSTIGGSGDGIVMIGCQGLNDVTNITEYPLLHYTTHVQNLVTHGQAYSKMYDVSTAYTSTSIVANFNNGNVQTITLSGGTTMTLENPTSNQYIIPGASYMIIIKQDPTTGDGSLSFGSQFLWEQGIAPTITTGTTAVDVLSFVVYNNGVYNPPLDVGNRLLGVRSANFS